MPRYFLPSYPCARRRLNAGAPEQAAGSLLLRRAYNIPGVEEYLITAVDYLRLVVEAIGAAVVGFGVIATAVRFVLTLLGIRDYSNTQIRLFLGRYLALVLEFQIGADILSTAVAPTFAAVLLLGALVVIRTVLNHFLSQELEREQIAPAP